MELSSIFVISDSKINIVTCFYGLVIEEKIVEIELSDVI